MSLVDLAIDSFVLSCYPYDALERSYGVFQEYLSIACVSRRSTSAGAVSETLRQMVASHNVFLQCCSVFPLQIATWPQTSGTATGTGTSVAALFNPTKLRSAPASHTRLAIAAGVYSTSTAHCSIAFNLEPASSYQIPWPSEHWECNSIVTC